MLAVQEKIESITRPAACASQLPGPGCEAANCTPTSKFQVLQTRGQGMGGEDRVPTCTSRILEHGRPIRGTGGALLLLTRDTTGSQRGGRCTVETPNSTGGLISV